LAKIRKGTMELGKRTSVARVNFQSMYRRTLTTKIIEIGCLKASLLTVLRAACIALVSLVMRDIRTPARIRLKKSIDWPAILAKSWLRMSVTTRLLTQFI